ncbi:hypothetical protein LOAG_00869 [Loa loa]|uniref:Uncharacterized protein n=1 Tax=Loa loa TaxID=7209 RepID=A0A1S0UCD6_LOALO|nr:hypothetical protein LOAG_00869 [Loa loa]EFO27618.1 hypothetical protein LOAG_00869 [Loa loa]
MRDFDVKAGNKIAEEKHVFHEIAFGCNPGEVTIKKMLQLTRYVTSTVGKIMSARMIESKVKSSYPIHSFSQSSPSVKAKCLLPSLRDNGKRDMISKYSK